MNRILRIVLGSVALISLDQATKAIARAYLPGTGYHSYLGGLVQLIYVENSGAFLSLGAEWPDAINLVVFSVLPLIFLGALMYYLIQNLSTLNSWQAWAFTLIFSGGVGNLIDRLFRNRHVTDFLLFGLNENFRTGILNVADIYVTGGILIMLVIYAMESIRKPKKEDVAEGVEVTEEDKTA